MSFVKQFQLLKEKASEITYIPYAAYSAQLKYEDFVLSNAETLAKLVQQIETFVDFKDSEGSRAHSILCNFSHQSAKTCNCKFADIKETLAKLNDKSKL